MIVELMKKAIKLYYEIITQYPDYSKKRTQIYPIYILIVS